MPDAVMQMNFDDGATKKRSLSLNINKRDGSPGHSLLCGRKGGLISTLRAVETGWLRKLDRKRALQETTSYLEEDLVIRGQLQERNCQLPPDIRCTIAVAASADGTTFATSHGDHTIRVYSVVPITGADGPVVPLTSRDAQSNALQQQALCSSSSSSPSFTFIAELKGHSRTPWTLSFHRQNPNLLVSGCLSGELRLWDLRLRTCVKSAILGQDRVTSVSFHPDSSVVAAACGRDLYLWDVQAEEVPKKCLETTIGFLCLYFHPNGKWLLTCEVRSLGNGAVAGSSPHTPHFCIRMRDLNDSLRSFRTLEPNAPEVDLLPVVLVYSESGTCISPCGRFLAVCLPPLTGEEENNMMAQGVSRSNAFVHQDAMNVDGEERSKHGHIAIISLQENSSFGKVLCTAAIPKSAKITCVRFSSSCRYLLVGYGGRDVRPVSVERLRRGLELYKFQHEGFGAHAVHSLSLVRDLTLSSDVLNAAEWQPLLGGCILYGTDTGRTVCLTFMRGVNSDSEAGNRSPSASDATTGLWSPPRPFVPEPTQQGGAPTHVPFAQQAMQ